jgi:4-hydroxybenzoate polyprenyltransferase
MTALQLPPQPQSIPGRGRTAWGLLRLLRPRQSLKNVFCLAGVLFGPGQLTNGRSWVLDLLTALIFSVASSAVYMFNDIIDRERDRVHPRKRKRPIASGDVGVAAASALAVLLAIAAVAGAAWLNLGVLACTLLYLANNLGYSLGLKHRALFDVFCIAFGFVLRLLAGIYALDSIPTAWITLCTFFLSVFLGSCKRRAELARMRGVQDQVHQRPVLSKYTLPYLDQLVNNGAVMAVTCYAMFTITSHKNPSLVITVPIVFFAVMHYKRLVLSFDYGEDPERLVVRDVRLVASGLLWLIVYLAVIHLDLHMFS